jgi:hypothetical protein
LKYLIFISILWGINLSPFSPSTEETLPVISYQEAELKANQILNFVDFDPVEQAQIIKTILYWENKSLEFRKVPETKRLPYSLLKLSKDNKTSFLIEKSPFVKNGKGINWIPSLSLFYQLMIVSYQMEAEYGKRLCPPLPVVLALLSQETQMRDLVGDQGKSVGMCQLYRPTARYIMRSSNKHIFKELLYFDKHRKHHFYSQRAMLEFVYHFIIREKRYSNRDKFVGVRNYNGGGEMARRYGKLVLLKSLYYEALIRGLNSESPQLAAKNLKEWTQEPLKYAFINFGGFDMLEAQKEEDVLELSEDEASEVQVFRYSIRESILTLLNSAPNPEQKQEISTIRLEVEDSFDDTETEINDPNSTYLLDDFKASNDCFFIVGKERTIYSYLGSNTFLIITQDNPYNFYYFQNGAKTIIHSKAIFNQKINEGKNVLCSAILGDTVKVKAGYPIFKVSRNQIIE